MIIKVNNVNYRKLHQELINAGIEVIEFANNAALDSEIAEVATITMVDGTDEKLIQTIINAHDSSPFLSPLTDKERIEQLEQMINLILTGEI